MQIKNRGKKWLAVLLSIVIAVSVSQTGYFSGKSNVVMAATLAQVIPGTTNLNVREAASTSSNRVTQIQGGQMMTVLDQPNSQWYHVSFTKDGTSESYTGYVHADFVRIVNSEASNPTDTDFEAYMTAQGFPESYKPYLRELHSLHPNWKFTAVQTGLDWNTVIENERNKQGQIKNLIQGTSSAPHYNWRETEVGYNWATDTWSPYDGTTWFAASEEIVAYYIDPRTYMDEMYIFAFEQLSYDSSIHGVSGVEAILVGTFMYNSCPEGESRKFSDEIMEAAATYNVSPYHLASRMRQEMGTTAGVNATGQSPNYPGIFNFFNVGSVDSAGGGAVNKGLAWASLTGSYGRPWNSAYKAIMGGAQFVGASYINRGQDTLYTQKFNVTYRDNLFGHQYMTNVQAPASEARTIYNAYRSNGLINAALVFKIPVYNNMPAQAVTKPADSGSPNHWLSSLTVSGCTLTPSFSGGTTEYSIIVGNEISSVTVSATTVNSKASISGTGTVNLSVGTNTVPITVTAQNGDKRTYTITIVRKDSNGNMSGGTENTPTISTNYKVDNNQISGITVGTDVQTLLSGITTNGGTVSVYQADGVTAKTGTVGTGDIVRVTNGSATINFTVIIYGDVSGDGIINALDLLKVQKHLIGASPLSGAYLEAANVKKSGSVSALDLLKIQKQIIGSAPIQQ